MGWLWHEHTPLGLVLGLAGGSFPVVFEEPKHMVSILSFLEAPV
jgi:hypothetical protein